MALQVGPYKFTGKHGNSVGYRSRRGETKYLRRVDIGASERVKTAPEYDGVRKHCSEFGALHMWSCNTCNALYSIGCVDSVRATSIALANVMRPLLDTRPIRYGRRVIPTGRARIEFAKYFGRYRMHDLYSVLGVTSLSHRIGNTNTWRIEEYISAQSWHIARSLGIDAVNISVCEYKLPLYNINSEYAAYIEGVADVHTTRTYTLTPDSSSIILQRNIRNPYGIYGVVLRIQAIAYRGASRHVLGMYNSCIYL